MRLMPLVVFATFLLLGSGCAPEGMADAAVPARQTAPSVLLPTESPTPVEEASVAVEPVLRTAEPAVVSESAPMPEVPATSPVTETQATVEQEPTATPGTARPAATRTPTAPAEGSQWKDHNLDSIAYSDAAKLDAVSPAFRGYVEQAMSTSDTDGCTVLGLSVLSVHPDGYVVGSISTDCGGGQAIWAERAEHWRLAMVLQGPPLCSELTEVGLPPGVGLLCDNGSGALSEY